jgi:hypothetical protein
MCDYETASHTTLILLQMSAPAPTPHSTPPSAPPSASEWVKNWSKIAQKTRCQICREEDQMFKCIACSTCSRSYHKTCVDPIRDWDASAERNEKFICDECAEVCLVCNDAEETDENPILICDNCDEWFHLQCLDEDDRPPEDEIGDESVEWLCADCYDEYASDNEWAETAIVPDDNMAKEDCFHRSRCACDFCRETHEAVDTWHEWQPTNSIQRSLKDAIDSKEGLVNQVMDDIHFRHGLPAPQ